jgi:hypothetical protein
VVRDEYGGRPERIWTEPADAKDLLARMRALPGYGDQKARIFLALLGKQFDVRPAGWREAAGDYGVEGSRRSIADVVDQTSLDVVRPTKTPLTAGATAARSAWRGTDGGPPRPRLLRRPAPGRRERVREVHAGRGDRDGLRSLPRGRLDARAAHHPRVGVGGVGGAGARPQHRRRPRGFFLRAETMHGFFSPLEANPGGDDPVFHEMSHGESFLEVLRTRFRWPGLYVLDEPESALSFSGSLALAGVLTDLLGTGTAQALACLPRRARAVPPPPRVTHKGQVRI